MRWLCLLGLVVACGGDRRPNQPPGCLELCWDECARRTEHVVCRSTCDERCSCGLARGNPCPLDITIFGDAGFVLQPSDAPPASLFHRPSDAAIQEAPDR